MQTVGFVRIEGPEEITPPAASLSRSFDSLSAATALCSQLPVSRSATSVSISLANEAASADQPSSPGSPGLAAAAATLQQVQSTDMLGEAEGAVDCLMQLSSDGTMKPSLLQPPKKRPLAAIAGAPAPSSRRKLKMKSSPLSQSSASHFSASDVSTMQPLSLLSSSNPGQLKLLAAAFKLCPTPTDEQLAAIASRVGMDEGTLSNWFQSRRALQDWVAQQPQVSSSSVRSMFYGDGEDAPPAAMPPPLAPLGCA